MLVPDPKHYIKVSQIEQFKKNMLEHEDASCQQPKKINQVDDVLSYRNLKNEEMYHLAKQR